MSTNLNRAAAALHDQAPTQTQLALGALAILFDKNGMAARRQADNLDSPDFYARELLGQEFAWHRAAQELRKLGTNL